MANLGLNDMQYIINEASKMVLNEITVKDAYARFYKDIPTHHYESIISIIQTGGDDFSDGMVLSSESKWALAVYRKNPQQFLEDFYKLRNENGDGYLDIFMRAKERGIISGIQADLNQYKSISELGKFINTLDVETILGRTKGEMSNAVNSAAKDIEIPYEDEIWKVIVPKTYEASCYWGQGTEWCTATRSTDKWYDKYSSEGPLFININKQNNRKYQFHFESGQFMDQHDYEIDKPVLDEIKATDGLKEFYKKHFLELMYESLWDNPKLYVNKDNNKEYVINDKGERITEDFDFIEGFNSVGLSKVRKDDLQNFIDTSGKLILPEWFNKIVYSRNDDYIRAGKNYNYQFLFDRKGRQINKVPLYQIYLNSSLNLIPVLDKNGYANYLNAISGDLFLTDININLERCLPFQYGRGIIVNTDNKMNIIDREGNILCDKWYDNIQYTHANITDDFKVFFYVRKNGLHNIMDYQGNIMCKHWFSHEINHWMRIGGKLYADVYLPKYNAWGKTDGLGNLVDGDYEDIQESKTTNKMLLNEINVLDAYTKYYSDIPAENYKEILARIQGDNDVLLPETKWVLGLYKRKSPRLMEDLYKLKNNFGDGYLDIFLRAKERRMLQGTDSDLNRFKSISELGAFVSTLDTDTILDKTKGEMSNAVHDAKDDIKLLYEDENWRVIIPKTHEASCYWAQGAHWCTATRESSKYFDEYTEDGPLYMNMNKNDVTKSFQFHFESEQFMDYYDESIEKPILKNEPDNIKLIEFYKKYLPKDSFMDMQADYLFCHTAERYRFVGEDGYAYMVDTNFKIIAGPFKWITDFNKDINLSRVGYPDGSSNVIDEKGNDILDEGCIPSSIGKPGIIFLENGKYFLRKNDGKVFDLSQYAHCEIISNGYIRVLWYEKNKVVENILDSNLQKIFDENYSHITTLYNGHYFKVQNKQGEYNVSDVNGNLIFDEWYYNISATNMFIEPVFALYDSVGVVINFARLNGEKVYKEDFFRFNHSVFFNKMKTHIGVAISKNGEKYIVHNDFSLTPYQDTRENKLTPNDVKFIVEQAAVKLINEIKVIDAYSAYYKDIPEEIFQQIVTTIQGDNTIMGKFTKWYLDMYRKNPEEALEYLPKLRNDQGRGLLNTWERCVQRGFVKAENSNLANYKSLNAWATYTLSISQHYRAWDRTQNEWSKAVNSAKNDIDKVYEDNEWLVIVPKTMDASCYWGNGTEWCTATRNERNNAFESYSKQGPLYINIDKRNGEKYQFHFSSGSFMDKKDQAISGAVMETIGASEGLINFYKNITSDDLGIQYKLFYYDIDEDDWFWVDNLEESFARVFIKGKGWNYMNNSNQFISEQWFEQVYEPYFNIPYAKVLINGKYNIINLSDGSIEFPAMYFDEIDEFDMYQDLDLSFSKAKRDGKITLLFTTCDKMGANSMNWMGRWVDYIGDIDDNYLIYIPIKNNNLWAYTTIDGEIIGDWYDGIWDWKNEYCKVEDNGKCNYMDEKGNLASNVWFDQCDDDVSLRGTAHVEIDGETYVFYAKHKLIEGYNDNGDDDEDDFRYHDDKE